MAPPAVITLCLNFLSCFLLGFSFNQAFAGAVVLSTTNTCAFKQQVTTLIEHASSAPSNALMVDSFRYEDNAPHCNNTVNYGSVDFESSKEVSHAFFNHVCQEKDPFKPVPEIFDSLRDGGAMLQEKPLSTLHDIQEFIDITSVMRNITKETYKAIRSPEHVREKPCIPLEDRHDGGFGHLMADGLVEMHSIHGKHCPPPSALKEKGPPPNVDGAERVLAAWLSVALFVSIVLWLDGLYSARQRAEWKKKLEEIPDWHAPPPTFDKELDRLERLEKFRRLFQDTPEGRNFRIVCYALRTNKFCGATMTPEFRNIIWMAYRSMIAGN
jgi:hypothetical protein